MFDNPNVPYETILEIGNIIHYDFSNKIKNLHTASFIEHNTNEQAEKEQNYWKEKYYALLEEYHELIKKLQL